MRGDTAIAKILKAEGVEWMACFPHQSLIEQAAKEGIRPILTRQERTGVNMADGFSRIKNGATVGVFAMQHGPGAENAFGGVAQAFADSVPVLLLPGGQARRRMGVHPNFEAYRNYGGITKWMGHINLVNRIPELMGMAFSQLKHGRGGPVLLEIPQDVGLEELLRVLADGKHEIRFSRPDGERVGCRADGGPMFADDTAIGGTYTLAALRAFVTMAQARKEARDTV